MVTVILPWRPQPSREPAFESVVAWYRQNLPDATIRAVDSEDEIFNLARCRNLGISAVANGEVAIINDADTIPELAPLLEAIAAAASSGVVHLPYTAYHWLGLSGTEQYRAGIRAATCDYELVLGACSGVYVTTPEAWWSHGGQDERFRGWGFEDAAWYLAHETLLGEPPRRHSGRVFALTHTQEVRQGIQYDLNAGLMGEYRQASVSIDAMRRVVFGESSTSGDGIFDNGLSLREAEFDSQV